MSSHHLQIDLTSTTPVYQQIVDSLRALLVAGKLEAGFRLPPVRQLAADLAVHHNTVAEAYRILAADGWLDLRQGRGAVVIERPASTASDADHQWCARRLRELIVQAIAKGISKDQLTSRFHEAMNDVSQNQS